MSDPATMQAQQPTFLLHVIDVASDAVALAGVLAASGLFSATSTAGQIIGAIVGIGGILAKAGVLHVKAQIGGGQ